MTSWEEYKNFGISVGTPSTYILTDIECPKCGKYIYMRTDRVLTSNPVQYSYYCDCGWGGSSYMKWNKIGKVSDVTIV